MAVLLTREALILAKSETTYGTDPTPTAAANAILTTVPEVSLSVETKEREMVAGPSFSPNEPFYYGKSFDINFSVEMRGFGTAYSTSDLPEAAPLLQACGFKQDLDATGGAEKVTYTLISDPVNATVSSGDTSSVNSCTIWLYWGGQLLKFNGCVGNMSFRGEMGGVPIADFSFKGKYLPANLDETEQSPHIPATVSYSSTKPPFISSAVLTWDSTAVGCSKIEWGLNNEINTLTTMASTNLDVERIYITGRAPAGSFDPVTLYEGDSNFLNYLGELEGNTSKAGLISIGSTQYERVKIGLGATIAGSGTRSKVSGVGFSDANGHRAFEVAFAMYGSQGVGNNELEIVFD
jgi:hypothetical protein